MVIISGLFSALANDNVSKERVKFMIGVKNVYSVTKFVEKETA